MQPSICCRAPSGFTTHAHVLRADHAHDLHARRWPCPPSPRPWSRRRCRRRCRTPRRRRGRSAPAFGVQPNCFAAAFSTRVIRASVRCFRRNSTGSMPAFAAMTSMCDSRANALVLAAGARHGPMANGCRPGVLAFQPPRATRAVVRDVVEVRRAALARADDEVVPEHDLLRGVEARPDLDHGGGTERVEEELLVAAPHDAHGLAGRATRGARPRWPAATRSCRRTRRRRTA